MLWRRCKVEILKVLGVTEGLIGYVLCPQPGLPPSNKFDNLLRVGGLGVLLTTVVAVPLSIPSFKQRASQKSD